jgi:PEP-CTERM motif
MRFSILLLALAACIAPLSGVGATLNTAGVTEGENITCCNPFNASFSFAEDVQATALASKTSTYYDQALDATTDSGFLFRRGANAQASASAGVLRASVDASYFLGRPGLTIPLTIGAAAVASFSDVVRASGPGFGFVPVTFQFSVDGRLSGAAVAQGAMSVNSASSVIEFLDTFANGPQFSCNGGFSCNGNQVTMMLRANTDISLTGTLAVVASARGLPINLNSIALYGNTGRIFVTVDDPLYRVTSESGFDYHPSPVPEPGSLSMLAAGLACLAVRFGASGRRARQRSSLASG